MFKIVVYIVTTLALAQQGYGLSKCYKGDQKSDGEPSLTETNCTTDCVRWQLDDPNADGKWVASMYCDGSAEAAAGAAELGLTAPGCSSQKDKCVELDGLLKQTFCCCSSDLCNGVGVTGLSGALAMALVAAIFWGQN